MPAYIFLFFFNDTATTEIYTLSLHDALPISDKAIGASAVNSVVYAGTGWMGAVGQSFATAGEGSDWPRTDFKSRSEEHTSELQSRQYLVCRLLLEKKKKHQRLYPA